MNSESTLVISEKGLMLLNMEQLAFLLELCPNDKVLISKVMQYKLLLGIEQDKISEISKADDYYDMVCESGDLDNAEKQDYLNKRTAFVEAETEGVEIIQEEIKKMGYLNSVELLETNSPIMAVNPFAEEDEVDLFNEGENEE